MKILAERQACDGCDVEVLTDEGEVAVWHFTTKPEGKDNEGVAITVETACGEIQKRVTANVKEKADTLEVQKAVLEKEVARTEATLASTKASLETVKAAIAAKPVVDPKEEPAEVVR